LDNSGKQPPTSNAIQFEKGVVVTGDIPQLKVEKMRWTEVVKRFDEPITPEPLEKSVTPEVLEYFRGWEASDMIINFRLRAPANFNAFYTHVEKGNYDEAANLFKIYLGSLGANAFSGLAAEKITAIKNAFAPNADRLKGNVDFIYAALSRVKKTQYKQFGAVSLEPADSWVDRQQRYMKQAKERLFATAVGLIDDSSFPSSMDKSALKLLVEKRIKEDESNFGAIKRIIGSQAPSWSNPSSLRDQLYIMLCDLGEIAETRNV